MLVKLYYVTTMLMNGSLLLLGAAFPYPFLAEAARGRSRMTSVATSDVSAGLEIIIGKCNTNRTHVHL